VKVGQHIEENLLKLWRDIEIDANSYVELDELIPYSCPDLAVNSVEPTRKRGLRTMTHVLGHSNYWENKEIASSNWEKLPLSWNQLHYAALQALMPTRTFWRLLMGTEADALKPISAGDMRANIETFAKHVCRRLPISLLAKEQKIAKLKREGLYAGCS